MAFGRFGPLLGRVHAAVADPRRLSYSVALEFVLVQPPADSSSSFPRPRRRRENLPRVLVRPFR